jgi:hypothetical protein
MFLIPEIYPNLMNFSASIVSKGLEYLHGSKILRKSKSTCLLRGKNLVYTSKHAVNQ